jgi:hypothetical protein
MAPPKFSHLRDEKFEDLKRKVKLKQMRSLSDLIYAFRIKIYLSISGLEPNRSWSIFTGLRSVSSFIIRCLYQRCRMLQPGQIEFHLLPQVILKVP